MVFWGPQLNRGGSGECKAKWGDEFGGELGVGEGIEQSSWALHLGGPFRAGKTSAPFGHPSGAIHLEERQVPPQHGKGQHHQAARQDQLGQVRLE